MDGCCHNLHYSFCSTTWSHYHLLYFRVECFKLGWNALKRELDKGRKKPVGPTFKFLGKYVYVFLAIIILILGILYNGIG